MTKLTLLKIGGSSITDKSVPYKVNDKNLKRFAKEIAKVKNQHIIISHGSGSFGHTSAAKYGGTHGYKTLIGISTVLRDAAKINEIVVDALIKEGVPAVSMRPRDIFLTSQGKTKKVSVQVIEEVISQGLVPVIYGDVIFDEKWNTTIFSGEKSLNLIAKLLIKKGYGINKIIQIGSTNGVLDQNGKTLKSIDKKNWLTVKKQISGAKEVDVTGGMRHKVEEALAVTKIGVKTLIIGDSPNNLFDAIMGKSPKGTLIK